ncbi:MAG: single-stranded DNA-binding protein [Anaerolineales bacterium]|nr:single-stranded DNA-binding protein [Anaerolineales bacterium]MDD5467720.1 single-stranded DNA-binding protein [Anaerolineales bacterium]
MFHTIIIVGNLGKDPELRYTASGQPLTNFSLASNRSYTSADGTQVKETIWFRVTVWGKQAETAKQYLHKGSRILVEGRLNPDPATGGPRIWNRQDGTPAASFEVTASQFRFLTARSEEEGGLPAGETIEPGGEDEIPF